MADNANRQQQAKVLRIGVVQGGKVVHERLIKPGQNVTIGESPKNTFVFAADGLPKRFTVFQAKGGGTYLLNFTEQMNGKVQLQDGIVGLDQARQRGDASRKAGQYSLSLSQKTRGKIVVGDVTVLFQFVAAPPESARKLARQDFRPKLLEEDDPIFLGFLALWSALAAVLMIYVYNTEPVEMVNMDEIPDRFVTIIQPSEEPPPSEVVEPEENPELEGQKVEKEKAEDKPKDQAEKKKPETKDEQVAEAKRIEKKREDAIAKSKLLAGLIGTRGENNSGDQVEDVFAEGDANFQDLKSALGEVDGAGVASEQAIATRQASDGGGRGDASIGSLNTSGSGGSADVGTVKSAAPKKVSASVGQMDVTSGEGVDAIRGVIRKYQGQIQACYEQQLKANPNLGGRVAVDVDITAGRVTTVVVSENSTGDATLASCITKRIRGWRFPSEVTDSVYLPFALNAS
jgi:outer membrane biosynthesis protein TonB